VLLAKMATKLGKDHTNSAYCTGGTDGRLISGVLLAHLVTVDPVTTTLDLIVFLIESSLSLIS
jgi:hypothetical protein